MLTRCLSKLNAGCIKKTRIPFFEILADWFCYFDCLLDGEQFTFPESCSSLYVYGLSRSADLLLPHSFAVVVARFPIARFAADGVEDIPAEEQHDIQQAEHDGHPCGCAADDEIIQIQRSIRNGKIFHLNRQNHEQQHLLIGVQRGIGKEQRQVEERVIRIAGNQRGDNRTEHADEIIQIELDLAPLILQSDANHIVEIQRKQDEDGRTGRRNEYERHQPPNLPAHQSGAGQRDERIEPITQRRPDIQQGKDDALTDDDVLHQVADGISTQFALQIEIDAVVFQAENLLLR